MSKKYLLDTNIFCYFEDSSLEYHNIVKKHVAELNDDDELYISLLLYYEIEFGYAFTKNIETKNKFKNLTKSIETDYLILPLTKEEAKIFGQLKVGYINKTGINTNIANRHNIDFMLASTAIAENVILVSHDKIFQKISEMFPKFKTEDWTKN